MSVNLTEINETFPACNTCKSHSVRNHGFTNNKKPRYYCYDCKRTFVLNPEETRAGLNPGYPPEKIKEALSLITEGYLLQDVADKMNVHIKTINNWKQKYIITRFDSVYPKLAEKRNRRWKALAK